MEPFTRLAGVAASLPMANVDTDVIMPKQFLKTVTREGLADGTFHDLRFDASGERVPGFVLNVAPWTDARILIVGPNFGCGSSREHAVWGLLQLGIRAIVGTSFAGIFYDNAARNGLLLVQAPATTVEEFHRLAANPAHCGMTVDLEERTIAAGGRTLAFEIEPLRRETLLSGRDPIGATLEWSRDIEAFERAQSASSPWLWEGRAPYPDEVR